MNAVWIISGLSKACDSNLADIVAEVMNTLLSKSG